MSDLAALVADAERQLSAPLALLVSAVLDADCDPAVRVHLNAAATHVSLALSRLAHIETPAGPAAALDSAAAAEPLDPAVGVVKFRERFTTCASCRGAATAMVKLAGSPFATACERHKALWVRRATAASTAQPTTQTPARRDPPVATTSGPDLSPVARTGEELTPSSAATVPPVARESTGAVVAPGAGASFATGSADCGFTLPATTPLPRFEPGEHRLIGLVRRP